MKKILILIFFSAFIVSCTNKNVEEKTNLDNNKKNRDE